MNEKNHVEAESFRKQGPLYSVRTEQALRGRALQYLGSGMI
jgi:hypothetical protein